MAENDAQPPLGAASVMLGKLLAPQPRPLRVIAAEIRQDWKKPNYAAVPYLSAMSELDKVTDAYYADSAASIVRYFLANAGTWRGETARRVKAELNKMVKNRY